MPNSKQIVYLSQAQYAELIANGSITVDGVTVTYDENDIYVTPQAEPVTDVRIAGTSVAANGVANVPAASADDYGVVKTNTNYGTQISYGNLAIVGASGSDIQAGTNGYKIIAPKTQHASAFYGLAKAAGADMASSSSPVGTYTPEAKGAIQSMLGVSDLIATEENNLVASKPYAVGDVFTANGKLYKATAAIAADGAIITDGANANCEEATIAAGFVKKTDYATSGERGTAGLVWDHNGAWGIKILNSSGWEGALSISAAREIDIKSGSNGSLPIVPIRQDASTFYGLAKVAGADEKDSTLPVGQYTDNAKAAIKSMIGVNVEDVQVNGTSIVSDGVANIPLADTSTAGVIQLMGSGGLNLNSQHLLYLSTAGANDIKAGTGYYKPITSNTQHQSVFYGLAKAAGDATQSSSSNAVGTYTDNAKASIKAMLGIQDGSTGTVDVTGTTPTITAVENTRYVCGEVTSLSFTPPASGISIVRFTSGSTVTVLTIPSTVKFPEWFDPTSLETNTIYEICVTDGEFGAVMSWAL